VDEAVEVVGDGKGSWTERLRTRLQLGSHLQEKGGVFPYIPAVPRRLFFAAKQRIAMT